MKNYILLLLFMFSTSFFHAQQEYMNVDVITYNIRMDHEGDRQNNWKFRKQEMLRHLKERSPDFLGLQEVEHHQLTYIMDSLKDYSYIGVGRDDGINSGEFSPILYNNKRFNLVSEHTIWLSATPEKVSRGWDAACNRVCTYGVFKDSRANEVLIMNTHFDHLGVEARSKSTKILLDLIRQFPEDMPKLLMGDLNFEPEDYLYTKICKKLTDVHTFATDPGMKAMGTFNGFEPEVNINRRIDYIFIDDKWKIIHYEIDATKRENGLQLSDHFPVYVKLAYKNSNSK